MKFVDELERLLKEATPGPWAVDQDERPDMEWNNHIVQANHPHLTVCFMAHDPDDNNECEATAHLIALLRNNAEKLIAVVEAAQNFEDDYKYGKSIRWGARLKLFAALAALEK